MDEQITSYDKLKMLLATKNINQKELAEKIGRSHSFVNKALNGRGARFTSDDVKNIRCLFGSAITNEYF